MIAMQPSESALWTATVHALRYAIWSRKPDALASLRLHVERLDREISALVCRQSFAWGDTKAPLAARLTMLEARMDDLRRIGDLVRASPLDHDAGATPESAMKAKPVTDSDGEVVGLAASDPGTDDLRDDLKRAASDIRHGWAVITQRAGYSAMGRQPGSGDVGPKQAQLAEQYHHWAKEMQRKRIQAFPVDDVVCSGLSRAECAARRRCRPERVYELLVAGLELYAGAYPPLGDG